MTVTIKAPPVYDLSKYEIITSWPLLNPKPALVILRATYGAYSVDPTYLNYVAGARAAGYPVWAYHYFLYEDNWVNQANIFLNTVKVGGVTNTFIPVIDIEGYPSNAGISQATANGMIENFINKIETELGRACFIYSSKNYLSYLYSTTPPAWLAKSSRVKWIAYYPSDPNTVSWLPTTYYPTGIPASQIGLWQYSPNGVVGGITGGVDLNQMSDWFKAAFNPAVPPAELTYEQKVDKLWAAHPELH